MKYVKLFENFTDELDYTLKEDSGGGKPTWVLKLGSKTWKLVKHLFDKDGRPKNDGVKRIEGYSKYTWNLYAQKYVSNGVEMHKIYGVCGTFTFGNAPTYCNQAERGNKKDAKVVLDYFISKYITHE